MQRDVLSHVHAVFFFVRVENSDSVRQIFGFLVSIRVSILGFHEIMLICLFALLRKGLN